MSDILKIDGTDSLLIDSEGSELLLEEPALTLSDLLADSGAQVELIVSGTYLDETGTPHTEWISQTGWDDEVGGASGIGTIPPLLTTNLRINQQINPLDPLSSFDTFGNIEISNNHLDYAGRYDPWRRYSVDGLDWTVYAVGILSNGTRVELSHVESTPLFELQGIGTPEVGSDTCLVRCKDRGNLDLPLQSITYSPPALYFPGTLSAVLNLGNNLNITGNQSISVWVYLEDPISTTQYIEFKDSGSAGHYLAVGLVGGGTIFGGVEILVRGQSPTTTTTAAAVLRALRWHRIDISIAATTRRIDIDGVPAVTTSSITGTPTASATDLEVGKSFLGRMHRLLHWTDARSNATMSAEGRTPITGTETNLRQGFLFGEGQGNQVASIKTGSALVAIIQPGVLWDTALWHYESILGQHEPFVLGTVPRVPVAWIDPPKQIGQVSRGAISILSELQSNHAAVLPANYMVNKSNGTLTVTSGALAGTYSATVTANNLWGTAVLFDGSTSTGTVSITMPAANKYVSFQFTPSTADVATRQLLGWEGTTSTFQVRMTNVLGTNTLTVLATNDAGTIFRASIAGVKARRRYSVVGSLDTSNPSIGLKLYVDGSLAATTAISGSWTGTKTTLSIGYRGATNDQFFPGTIDEIVIGNASCDLSTAKALHALPATSITAAIIAGYHLDEATGTTAAPFVGANSITFANITWVAGRSAITDLARVVLYTTGYEETDLDPDSWLAALNKNSADCGWFVTGGVKAIDIINIILGGLGFIIYKSLGLICIKRFEGLTGIVDRVLDPLIDLQASPIETLPCDPAIYHWIITYATNNSKQDAANIAGGLATTDPDRYQYGAMAYKSIPKSDGSILSRFPNAETRTRTTALLNAIDAEAEAARLLLVHRHGADRKSLATFIGIGQIDILDEVGPLIEECDLDAGDSIVISISIEDGSGTITIWRPAID